MRLRASAPLLVAMASVATVALVLAAVYAVYFKPDPWPALSAPAPAACGEPLTSKLLIVVGDSVRREAMEEPVLVPFFTEMGERGVRGILTVPGPSLTGVSVLSFGTGLTPPLKTAMSNFVVPRWEDEHVFGLLAERGVRQGFFGDDTWYKAFGAAAEWQDVYPFTDFYGEFAGDWYPRDRAVVDVVNGVLERASWNCVVVHFSTTDKLAHRYGARIFDPRTNHPTIYARAVNNIDRVTQHFYRLAGSDTTVLLLSDHGCTVSGTHGGFDLETRQVRFAMAGPGIRRVAGEVELESGEVAPLLCRLFGARAPRCAELPLRDELLELEPAEAEEVHAVNLRTRESFVMGTALAAGIKIEPIVAAPAPRSPAAHRRIFTVLNAALATELAARRDLLKWTTLALTALAVLGLLLGAERHLADAGSARRLTGRRWVAALLAAAVTVTGLLLWRWWAFGVMRLADRIADLSVVGLAAASAALGLGVGLAVKQRVQTWTRFAPWALVILVSLFPVIWAYGPFLTAAFAATLGMAAFVFGTAGAQRPARSSFLLGAACLTAVLSLSRHWLDFDTQALFRADPDLLGRLGAIGGPLGLAAFVLIRAWRCAGPAERRGVGLVAALIAGTLAAAWVGREWAWLPAGRIALAAYAGGLIVIARRDLPAGLRCMLLSVLHVALYRLFVSDANLMALTVFAVGCHAIAGALGGRPVTAAGIAVFVLADLTYFFAQGYHYGLSALDMNTAFVLVRGAIDLPAAAFALVLQQFVPTFIVVVCLWQMVDGAVDPEAPGATRVMPVAAAFLAMQAARIAACYLVTPLFESDGWAFLRSVHVQAFEAVRLAMAAAAWFLVSMLRPRLVSSKAP